MSQKANPTIIGIFVIIAAGLGLGAILVLTSGSFLRDRDRFVMYFEGDISGLNIGAPVDYKGVQIGSVCEIRLEYNQDDGKVLIPIYAEFDPKRINYTGNATTRKGLNRQIKNGLRARLQTQSFVTGLLKVSLVEEPDTEIRLVSADPEVDEIPTIPGITEVLMDRLTDLPIEDIAGNVNSSLEGITTLVSSPDLKETVAALNRTTKELERLTIGLNKEIPLLAGELRGSNDAFQKTLIETQGLISDLRPLSKELEKSLPPLMKSAQKNSDAFLQTQKELQDSMHQLQELMDERSPAMYQFANAMEKVAGAADSMQQFLDYLQRHPESFLSGKSDKE